MTSSALSSTPTIFGGRRRAAQREYGVDVNGAAFAEGSLSGYAHGVGTVNNTNVWTSPDVILQTATRANLPLQQLGARVADAVEDDFSLWRALKSWSDSRRAFRRCIRASGFDPVQYEHRNPVRAPERGESSFRRPLSGETVKAYKPDAAVYHMAIASSITTPPKS